METTAARHLHEGTGCSAVPASIEGRSVLLGFNPDPHEHPRRTIGSLGAVLSRRLLHALWVLPHQLPWPVDSLDPVDIATLEAPEAAGFVSVGDGDMTRLYQPPGEVVAVGVRSARLADAVQRAALFPAVFSRYAIGAKVSRHDGDAIAEAAEYGIGTVLPGPSGLVAHTDAATPRTGVPGVYRWWIAEVAYGSWLQANVH